MLLLVSLAAPAGVRPADPTPTVGIFYLATPEGRPAGRDTHNCAQAQHPATPKATFVSLLPCVAGSSTIYVRDGTYTQSLSVLPGGTAEAPTTLTSYPGETAVLKPAVAGGTILKLTQARHVVIKRLHLDGAGKSAHGLVIGGEAGQVTVEELTVWHVLGSALLLDGTADNVLRQSTILEQPGTHAPLAAIALVGGARDNLVEGNVITTFGASCLASEGQPERLNATNVFRGNRCLKGTGAFPAAVLTWSHRDRLVNNVLAQSGGGVDVGPGAEHTLVYHNTVADHKAAPGYGIRIAPTTTGVALVNNIVVGNREGIVDPSGAARSLANFTDEPRFVRPEAGNYRVRANSKALGRGTDLRSDVPTDLLGQPRRLPVTPGAFEAVTLPPERSLRAVGCTHYAAPNGTGNGLSASTPFRIIDFWAVAAPGAKLCLLDGTYTGGANLIRPPAGLAGTAGNPITIAAMNDGAVLLDAAYSTDNGTFCSAPIVLCHPTNQWFVIQGMNAARGNYGGVGVDNGASHNVFRRIVAWDGAGPDCDLNASVVGAAFGEDNTFEDIAAWGCGRKMWAPYQDTNTKVIRVLIIKFKFINSPGGYEGGGAPFSWAYNSIGGNFIANTIASQDAAYGGNADENCAGILDHDWYYDGKPDEDVHHTLRGLIAYQIDPQVPSPCTIRNLGTAAGPGVGATHVVATDARNLLSLRRNTGFPPEGIIPVNYTEGGNFQANWTDSLGPTTAGATNDTNGGVLPLSSFQNGLLQLDATSQPANGAWLRYQYNADMSLSTRPLWPWPMEQRIAAALPISGYADRGLDGQGAVNLTPLMMQMTGSSLAGPAWTPIVGTFYLSTAGTQHECELAQDPGTPYSVTTQGDLAAAFACGLGGSTYVLQDGAYPSVRTSLTPIPGFFAQPPKKVYFGD
jgi:hypothetical protein